MSLLLRREWTFRSIEDEILIVRGADLRPGEEAEGPHLALLNIDRWLSEPFQASILAEMCFSSVGVGGADIGPRDQLRARLEEAFGSRSLVVIRPASRRRGGAAPEASRLPREIGGGRSVSADQASEGQRHGQRGWEVPGRTTTALVAAKSDLAPGEPFEEAQVPISLLDRWVADVPQRTKLREMYRAVYGPGDAAAHSTATLKNKLEAAFRKKELVMLRVSRGGSGGGGGGGGKPGDDKAAKDEKEAAKAPPLPKKPEKTWVRFRLLDEDGEPMDGEPYEMVDSNGTERKGKLDKDGTVYIPPILTPGDCTITFPEIHLNPLKNPKRKRTRKIG